MTTQEPETTAVETPKDSVLSVTTPSTTVGGSLADQVEALLAEHLDSKLSDLQNRLTTMDKDIVVVKADINGLKKPLQAAQKVYEEEEKKRLAKEKDKENRMKNKAPKDAAGLSATEKPRLAKTDDDKSHPGTATLTPAISKRDIHESVKPEKKPVKKDAGENGENEKTAPTKKKEEKEAKEAPVKPQPAKKDQPETKKPVEKPAERPTTAKPAKEAKPSGPSEEEKEKAAKARAEERKAAADARQALKDKAVADKAAQKKDASEKAKTEKPEPKPAAKPTETTKPEGKTQKPDKETEKPEAKPVEKPQTAPKPVNKPTPTTKPAEKIEKPEKTPAKPADKKQPEEKKPQPPKGQPTTEKQPIRGKQEKPVPKPADKTAEPVKQPDTKTAKAGKDDPKQQGAKTASKPEEPKSARQPVTGANQDTKEEPSKDSTPTKTEDIKEAESEKTVKKVPETDTEVTGTTDAEALTESVAMTETQQLEESVQPTDSHIAEHQVVNEECKEQLEIQVAPTEEHVEPERTTEPTQQILQPKVDQVQDEQPAQVSESLQDKSIERPAEVNHVTVSEHKKDESIKSSSHKALEDKSKPASRKQSLSAMSSAKASKEGSKRSIPEVVTHKENLPKENGVSSKSSRKSLSAKQSRKSSEKHESSEKLTANHAVAIQKVESNPDVQEAISAVITEEPVAQEESPVHEAHTTHSESLKPEQSIQGARASDAPIEQPKTEVPATKALNTENKVEAEISEKHESAPLVDQSKPKDTTEVNGDAHVEDDKVEVEHTEPIPSPDKNVTIDDDVKKARAELDGSLTAEEFVKGIGRESQTPAKQSDILTTEVLEKIEHEIDLSNSEANKRSGEDDKKEGQPPADDIEALLDYDSELEINPNTSDDRLDNIDMAVIESERSGKDDESEISQKIGVSEINILEPEEAQKAFKKKNERSFIEKSREELIPQAEFNQDEPSFKFSDEGEEDIDANKLASPGKNGGDAHHENLPNFDLTDVKDDENERVKEIKIEDLPSLGDDVNAANPVNFLLSKVTK